MISLAVLALAGSVGAQVQGVQVTTAGSAPVIQIHLSGATPQVSVQRERDAVRVWLERTSLGGPFSGGDRFEWVADGGSTATPGSLSLGALGIQRFADRVCLYFRLAPNMQIDVRSSPALVTLVLHEPVVPPVATPPPPAAPPAAVAEAAPAAPEPMPAAEPAPAAPEPMAAAPEPAPAAPQPAAVPDTSLPAASLSAEPSPEPTPSPESSGEMLRKLFPSSAPPAGTAAEAGETRFVSSDELYHKLFPSAPTEPEAPAPPVPETRAGPSGPRTLMLGPFTLRPSVRVGYIDGDTTFLSPEPTNAHYLQIEPSVELETVFGDGRLNLAYMPDFRTLASDELLEEPTHRLAANLELPLGTRMRLAASETFVNGVLETREVDPGNEYFFGLSRFRRNLVTANVSAEVAPRLTLEAAGALNTVRFDDPGGFFPYDSRSGFAGVGFELTRTLKAAFGYRYDHVPPPADRPVAESTAHAAEARVSGDITPLLTGQVTVGYRHQTSPRAPESGRHFQGVVASATVSRRLGDVSWVNLMVSRATPVSNFENNAFYVSTYVGGNLMLPLPFGASVDGGADYRWNDYRTDAAALGRPRADTIFGWHAGLRRSLGGITSVSAAYRQDRRRSNIDEFDTTVGGLIVQLELNVSSGTPRR